MTKAAFDKIAEGLREAVDAMGVPVFRDGVQTLNAIRVVQKHLHDNWISEGCKDDPMFSCMSCRAANLDRELEALAADIEDDIGRELAKLA